MDLTFIKETAPNAGYKADDSIDMEDFGKLRRYRSVYLLPLLVYLALMFSISDLICFIDIDESGESMFPMVHWAIFAVLAVTAPTAIAIVQLAPDPSLALLAGGLMTSLGLIWTYFVLGSSGTAVFGVFCGAGMSLSLSAAFISLAPFFISYRLLTSIFTLASASVVMMSFHSLMEHMNKVMGSKTFLVISPAILLSSVIPAMFYVCQKKKLSSLEKDADSNSALRKMKDVFLTEEVLACKPESCSNKAGFCTATIRWLKEGWLFSCISVLVWLMWGAGMDTTWMSLLYSPGVDSTLVAMGWKGQFFESYISLTVLQMLMSLSVYGIKMLSEFLSKKTNACERVMLASNYMHLGLLGASGLILALYSEHTVGFHHHLLFTISFGLQIDDLSDLENQDSLIRRKQRAFVLCHQHSKDRLESESSSTPALDRCYLIAYLLSLFLMSFLAMLLGLQIPYLLGLIAKLPFISSLFTTYGLIITSVTALGISLTQPDTWLRKQSSFTSVL